MSYPLNPETIVIKNKFYPRGLTEKMVYDYYQKVKPKILPQFRVRDLMVYIFTEENKFIIRKKGKDNKPIKLSNSNYDERITGRSVSFHSIVGMYEDIGIIDIDTDNFKDAKEATLDVYDEIIKAPFVSSVQIRYTGKTSFHIFCELNRKTKVDIIRGLFENYIRRTNLIKKYTVEKKRRSGIVNLDLFRNVNGASFITLHSLSEIGLICSEVDPMRIVTFNNREYIVK